MLNPLLGVTAERCLPLFTDLAVKSAVVLAVTLAVWAGMRLAAILDIRRPRRPVTCRTAALSLVLALAAAVPLASLRRAAHADSPTAADSPAPSSGAPTEAEITAVQQHLQGLEQERARYTVAHPNTLSPAQIATIDRLIVQTEANRDQEKFRAWEAVDNARLRREVEKPHTQQERQQIGGRYSPLNTSAPSS